MILFPWGYLELYKEQLLWAHRKNEHKKYLSLFLTSKENSFGVKNQGNEKDSFMQMHKFFQW